MNSYFKCCHYNLYWCKKYRENILNRKNWKTFNFFCRRLEQNTYIRRKKKSFNFQTNSIQYEDQWYENVLRKKYLDERLVFSALAYMRQGNVCCVLASYIISRTKIIGLVVFWKRSSSLFFNGASISFLFKLNLIFISSLSRFFFSFYFTLILVVEH